MRAVLWLTAAFAIFYGGYWAVGSRALLQGTEAALADMRRAGRADYGAVTLQGFPSRFDMTVTEPSLTSDDGAVRWTAPEIMIYALAYKPHHIIAVLPGEQTIRFGRDDYAIRSDDLRASVVFGIDPDLPLARAQSVGTGLVVASDQGWDAAAGEARLALRQGADATEQELGAELFAVELSGRPADLLEEADLPASGGHMRIDALLRLNQPLDRHAAEGGVRIMQADIRGAELDWGNVRLDGTGQIEITASGQPEGRIALTVRNWRAALPLATALGLIKPETAPTVEKALDGLARLSGGEELTLPLVFSNGWMSLGPVPLGPAPRL